MYVIDELPAAGTPIFYQFGNGKIHRAVIEQGIIKTHCGIHRMVPIRTLRGSSWLRLADPNRDSIYPVLPYQGQPQRCERCR